MERFYFFGHTECVLYWLQKHAKCWREKQEYNGWGKEILVYRNRWKYTLMVTLMNKYFQFYMSRLASLALLKLMVFYVSNSCVKMFTLTSYNLSNLYVHNCSRFVKFGTIAVMGESGFRMIHNLIHFWCHCIIKRLSWEPASPRPAPTAEATPLKLQFSRFLSNDTSFTFLSLICSDNKIFLHHAPRLPPLF